MYEWSCCCDCDGGLELSLPVPGCDPSKDVEKGVKPAAGEADAEAGAKRYPPPTPPSRSRSATTLVRDMRQIPAVVGEMGEDATPGDVTMPMPTPTRGCKEDGLTASAAMAATCAPSALDASS